MCLAQLTQSLKDYVNDKLGSALSKVGRKVVSCNVVLSVHKNPSIEKNQELEVVINVKGTTLRTKEKTHDMYAHPNLPSHAHIFLPSFLPSLSPFFLVLFLLHVGALSLCISWALAGYLPCMAALTYVMRVCMDDMRLCMAGMLPLTRPPTR